ncbi:winged helix-turn-helix transcriptional regulator, partial [Streptomyces cadmiisoli]
MAVARRPGADQCGIAAAMSVIDGKWKVSLLWVLDQRPHRFGELRRLLPGISEK